MKLLSHCGINVISEACLKPCLLRLHYSMWPVDTHVVKFSLNHFNVQPVTACCVVSGHMHVGVFYVVVAVRVEHFRQLVMAVLCAELISLLKFKAVAPILIHSGTAVVVLHRNFSFGELMWLERIPAGKSLLSGYVCGCRNSCAR